MAVGGSGLGLMFEKKRCQCSITEILKIGKSLTDLSHLHAL